MGLPNILFRPLQFVSFNLVLFLMDGSPKDHCCDLETRILFTHLGQRVFLVFHHLIHISTSHFWVPFPHGTGTF